MKRLFLPRAWPRGPQEGFLFALGLLALAGCAGGHPHETDAPMFSRTVPAFAKPIAQLAGHVRWRDGMLSGRADLKAALGEKLRRFDVVFLSAPYKGTSLFIPGRFSHAGIWLGDVEDWRGVDLPPRLRTALVNGQGFFHADREGVRFSGIDEIFDADHAVIVGPPANPGARDAARRIEALSGRDYDFNFDGVDRSAFLCTELVLEILKIEPIVTSGFLGRSFASPDQLFQTLLAKGGPLILNAAAR